LWYDTHMGRRRRIRWLVALVLVVVPLLGCWALSASGVGAVSRRGLSARLTVEQRLDVLWAPCAPDHPARVAVFHTNSRRQNRFVTERLRVLLMVPVWPACA
jgi:hypothetical protein